MARKLVTLLGVPGSGKSTLYAHLAKTRFTAFEKAQAYSLGRWVVAEKIRRPFPALFFRSKIFLHYYLARYVSNISNLERKYHESIELFSRRISAGLTSGHITPRMYMEYNCFVYDALSRLVLSKEFPDPFDIVLQDEGWLNLAMVTLNWGEQHEWQEWLTGILEALPAPTQVIWLRGAAELSEERQRKRNRFATMYSGRQSIREMAGNIEERVQAALPLLEKHGIAVCQVDAKIAIDKNTIIATKFINSPDTK